MVQSGNIIREKKEKYMFNEIDVMTWPRREIFYYFSQMAPTGYSITVEVDVTNVVKVTKENGLKFFPAYLWLVTKNLNRQTEFRCAVHDGKFGYFDTLTPLYATWHEDTKTFSLMWTEYEKNFIDFYDKYMENQRKYGENNNIIANDTPPPPNAYTVSAIPWVNFTHFAVHSYENKPYYFPSIEAGRYRNENGRMLMPLSLTCHHATTDGYHISEFLKDLKADIDNFEEYIK